MRNWLKSLWPGGRTCPVCGQGGKQKNRPCPRCACNLDGLGRSPEMLRVQAPKSPLFRGAFPSPVVMESLGYYQVELRTDEDQLGTPQLFYRLQNARLDTSSAITPPIVQQMKPFPIIPQPTTKR